MESFDASAVRLEKAAEYYKACLKHIEFCHDSLFLNLASRISTLETKLTNLENVFLSFRSGTSGLREVIDTTTKRANETRNILEDLVSELDINSDIMREDMKNIKSRLENG